MRQLLSDKEYMIMSRSLNKIMLIGNVGNDPDVRTTSSGTPIANMSLATTRKWKDGSGEQKEKTEWHRLTVWGKLVDVVERYVKKGDRLYVEGRIEYSESESDGQKKYWTDVNVFEMLMLGSTGAGDQGGGGRGGGFQGDSSPAPAPAPPISEPDDDLPF
jgi:single-strand DNA-binding protein